MFVLVIGALLPQALMRTEVIESLQRVLYRVPSNVSAETLPAQLK
jgi:hypothetical protein